jgi:ATP-dependent DNA helicase DinG
VTPRRGSARAWREGPGRAGGAVLPAVALAGLDGIEADGPAVPAGPAPDLPALHLTPDAAERIRREIERAGGREVCFLARVGPERSLVDPRPVARGNHEAVVAAAHDAPQGGVMIHNHPSGLLEPSNADLAVAVRVWEEGLGTALVDNDATRIYVVVEPPEPKVITPLDADALERLLGDDGPLAALHPGYEDRPGQRRMLRLIAERYNEGGVAITEAGTGTGKSLAYLLPAAAWALQNDERTVISTATINLQEQLVGKDLPLVRDLLGGELTWALVKGRGNYVSIRRALLAAEEAPSLFESEREGELAALLDWIETTDDGSLADLPVVPSEDVWEEVRSDADVCLRAKCPHFQRCFFQRARRKAQGAQLLVVNHHLLFTDLAVRRATQNWSQAAVLPPAKRLVLDEAHNTEDAATSHMGVDVTRRGVMRTLGRLERNGRGVLPALLAELAHEGEELTLRARVAERVMPALEHAQRAAVRFVDGLEERVDLNDAEPARLGASGIGEPADDPEIADALEGITATFSKLVRELAELRERVELDDARGQRLEGRLLDVRAVERRLEAAVHGLRLVLAPGPEDAQSWVRWMETRGAGRRRNLALAAAPIDLGAVLRDALFGRHETVTLSSATLATRGGFDFLRGRLGIHPAGMALMERPPRVVEEVIPSPFDFARQTLLAVPTDLPDAGAPEAFGPLQEATARVVEDAARMTGGGLFVLFTSHRALRRVAELLRARGVDGRWPLFVHGEDDRHRLLGRFVESGSGVLLGTASFWEGVDVPGEPLRGLVIQKIPFRVPTEPIVAARLEAIEEAGGDPFHEYLLPLAALRLKQGFGRLIRSRSDRGAVLLLDDRFVRKRYGRYLRDSLPPAPLVDGPWEEVARAVGSFYGSRPQR